VLRRSTFSGIHPESVLLHGTLVIIIIIASVPWGSTFWDEFQKKAFKTFFVKKKKKQGEKERKTVEEKRKRRREERRRM
jgi:hypothetical protein